MAIRTSFTFGLLIFVSAALRSQQTVETQVLQEEANRFTAMVARDTLLLRGMLDDKLVYTHSNGLSESRTEHLNSIGSGSIIYRSMQRESGARVRMYGKIALVNGKVNVSGVLNGKDFKVLLLYSAVYRKNKRHWVLLNWQSTRLQTE